MCFQAVNLSSQSMLFYCDSAAYAGLPEYQHMRSWLEPAVNYEHDDPLEAVRYLLSRDGGAVDLRSFPCLQLIYHLQLSYALKNIKAYREAESNALIALTNDPISGNRYAQEILSLLASLALEQEHYEKAKEYYRRNLALAEQQGMVLTLAGALNNLGLTYLRMDSLKTAKTYFERAYLELEKHQSTHVHVGAAILDNLADVAILSHDTTSALNLLKRKEHTLNQIAPDTARFLDTWITLSKLHLIRKEPDTAYRYLLMTDSLSKAYSGFSSAQAYLVQRIWYDYYVLTGQKSEISEVMDRLYDLHSASIAELEVEKEDLSQALRKYAEYTVDQVKAVGELQIDRLKESARHRLRIMVLVASLIAISLGLILVYFYYRQRNAKQRIESLNLRMHLNEQTLLNEQLAKDLLQKDLQAKEHDLTSIAIDNARRKEWNSTVLDKLSSVLDEPSEKRMEGVRKLYYQLIHQNQVQERLSITQDNHDLINKSFLNKLRESYPDLTPSEIDLCILLRLGLSGKEIAQMRNIDSESIRKAKYRLRKRMQFSTAEELHEFLVGL